MVIIQAVWFCETRVSMSVKASELFLREEIEDEVCEGWVTAKLF